MNERKSPDRAAEREAERLKRERAIAIGRAFQLSGSAFGAGLLIYGGIWLDRRFGTSPVLLFVGLLLAFISIGYNLYELAKVPVSKPAKRPTDRPKKSWDEWDREEREERGPDDDQGEYVTRKR